MTLRFLLISPALALAALSTGCSSSPPPAPAAKKEVKPVSPISGQSALFSMYQVARTWAPDAMVLKLDNMDIPEAKPEPGKYGAWRAMFVSPSRRIKRDYTFSVADSGPTLHKGPFAGPETSYIPNPTIRPISIQDVKIDTTDALEAALKNKELKAFAEKNPDLPVQFVLEWTSQTPLPAWRVIWGRSVGTSAASAYIDSREGKFLRKSR
jgi:hypothetical protein